MRGGTIFKGGGQIFEVKNVASAPIKTGAIALAARLRDTGGVCRSWSFFENIVLNDAIWCTIFHHVILFNSMYAAGCLLL